MSRQHRALPCPVSQRRAARRRTTQHRATQRNARQRNNEFVERTQRVRSRSRSSRMHSSSSNTYPLPGADNVRGKCQWVVFNTSTRTVTPELAPKVQVLTVPLPFAIVAFPGVCKSLQALLFSSSKGELPARYRRAQHHQHRVGQSIIGTSIQCCR